MYINKCPLFSNKRSMIMMSRKMSFIIVYVTYYTKNVVSCEPVDVFLVAVNHVA